MKDEFDSIVQRIFQLQTLLHRYQWHSRHKEKTRCDYDFIRNPHRGQGRVLAVLKLKPQIAQKDLMYLLDMRQQSLSELLQKLEKKGFILRRPSEEDRRITLVTLTEEGRNAAPDPENEENGMEKVFTCLSTAELQQLKDYLDRLSDALKREMSLTEQEHQDYGASWEDYASFWDYERQHLLNSFHAGMHHRHGQKSVSTDRSTSDSAKERRPEKKK